MAGSAPGWFDSFRNGKLQGVVSLRCLPPVASLICAYVLRCFPLLDLQPGGFFRCLLSLTLPVSIGGRFLPPFNVRSLLHTPICVDLHGRQFDLLHACSRAAHHTEVQCPSGFFHLGYGGHVEAKGLCFIGNG